MGFFKQMKEGWQKALNYGFGKRFKETLEEAFEPIPEHLQKYYAYWDSREFSPEVNKTLAEIADLIDPAVVKKIIKKAKELQKVDKHKIDNVMGMIPDNIKNVDNLDDLVKEMLIYVKGTIKF